MEIIIIKIWWQGWGVRTQRIGIDKRSSLEVWVMWRKPRTFKNLIRDCKKMVRRKIKFEDTISGRKCKEVAEYLREIEVKRKNKNKLAGKI